MSRRRKNERQKKKIIGITTLAAIILGVATYAWFIGTQTVTVSSFDVEIASTESLLLSLDGKKWDTTVNIAKEILNDVSYPGHKNTWGTGLVPVSTIGEVDRVSSRIKMFEKASITSTKGGYRIMVNQVPTDTEIEYGGYVAFDLFVKNFSGSKYLTEYTYLNEEAVYLDIQSGVEISKNGGVKETGIENSVRVAFVPIGRVPANVTDQSIITGITCGTAPGAVINHGTGAAPINQVGICERTQIWEPNDTMHVKNAIRWYEESCRERTGGANSFTYTANACKEIKNGEYSRTYPIKKEILDSYYVDVYDGADYNGYEGSSEYLHEFPYFTDSIKEQQGLDRPEFMRLAPNSITKLRIYIYIEGQDIDNYELAALGAKVSVNFGFTKERFEEEDIDYEGVPTQQPVINLPANSNPYVISAGTIFDPYAIGVTSTYIKLVKVEDADTYVETTDADILTVLESTVEDDVPGTYYVRYRALDARGNSATTTMTVVVNP